MAKIDLEVVKRVLKHSGLETSVMSEILGELQSAIADEQTNQEEPKKAPEKKQFVFVISDPNKEFSGKDLVGWVLQLPESEAMQSVPEKLQKVAKSFNLSQKGRKHPVETIGETCEYVSAKIFKEQKLWLKTKAPVLVIPMQNQLENVKARRSEKF